MNVFGLTYDYLWSVQVEIWKRGMGSTQVLQYQCSLTLHNMPFGCVVAMYDTCYEGVFGKLHLEVKELDVKGDFISTHTDRCLGVNLVPYETGKIHFCLKKYAC